MTTTPTQSDYRPPSLPLQLVAFDFDGTLADTFPWFDAILGDVAQQFGFRAPDSAGKAALRQVDARAILKTLGIPLWKAPVILRHIRARMAATAPQIGLFEGVADSLQALAATGLRLAVVSSNAEHNVRRILGEDIARLFTHYGCGTDLFGKPAKLKRLLSQHACPPRAGMLIGDELRDVHAAKDVGMRSGVVSWGYNDIDVLIGEQPDEVFRHPCEWVERLVSPADRTG